MFQQLAPHCSHKFGIHHASANMMQAYLNYCVNPDLNSLIVSQLVPFLSHHH